jgi:hypothetical protein
MDHSFQYLCHQILRASREFQNELSVEILYRIMMNDIIFKGIYISI